MESQLRPLSFFEGEDLKVVEMVAELLTLDFLHQGGHHAVRQPIPHFTLHISFLLWRA